MKELKNVSALFFDAFIKRTEFVIQFGAELKEVSLNRIVFELEDLDNEIFQNYYKKIPEDDKHKWFKLKIEYQED